MPGLENNFGNGRQLNIFANSSFNKETQENNFEKYNNTTLEKVEDKDTLGRNREDIIKASKSFNDEIIASIVFKDKKWFIEGEDADKWITKNEEFHKEILNR